jgi:hypothetical protein
MELVEDTAHFITDYQKTLNVKIEKQVVILNS